MRPAILSVGRAPLATEALAIGPLATALRDGLDERPRVMASRPYRAGVVELVDAPDSKSGSARSVGSTPTTRTTTVRDSQSSLGPTSDVTGIVSHSCDAWALELLERGEVRPNGEWKTKFGGMLSKHASSQPTG